MSKYTDLMAKKDELLAKLKEIEEIYEGTDIILEAIKKQRWYFFENKQEILMDKLTGILWANLVCFPWSKEECSGEKYTIKKARDFLQTYEADGFNNWVLPNIDDLKFILQTDKPFPFKQGANWRILEKNYWLIDVGYTNLDYCNIWNSNTCISFLLPCNHSLVQNSDYVNNISENNHVHTEKERLQFTLDLFVQNDLLPIFYNNAEITILFKKIYFEKPRIIEQLQEVQAQLDKLQTVVLLSAEFDYRQLLVNYNLTEIDKSIIKYYQSVQQWINALLNNLEKFEQQKRNTINEFNNISLKLSKTISNNNNLTNEENNLLQKRQKFLQGKLSLDMNIVKRRLLAIKEQAEDVEERIEQINNSETFFKDLAQLEKEDRPSFTLVAEDTANILTKALQRINYIETNRRFATVAVDVWEQWTEDYKAFKTKDKEELKNSAEQDGIDESIWRSWYADWQKLRFNIEEKIQPALARGLKGDIPTEKENEITVIEQLIRCLEMYKESIDKFYLEERKGIYQKYAFVPSGELQDKFETESEIYKRTAKFQTDLQEIIFACSKVADRMFILKWAENLLDIQIDEIIAFVADRDLQEISHEVLQSFSQLKQKNYDAYLNDAKAYSKEKANREKQYNSLMFKMRSELNKQK